MVGGLRGHVGVEALVEPGLLELVVRDEAVPELVAGLVDGDALGALQLGRGEDGGAAGEERRVLHAPRGRAPGRVDHRDLGVGVGRRPGAVGPQRDLRGLEVAIGEVRVLGLHEQADVHRRVAGVLEARAPLEEAPARGPREVVDVLLDEAEGLGPVGVVGLATRAGPSRPPRSPSAGSASRRRRRSRRRTRSRGRTGGSSTRPSRRRRSWGTTARRSGSRAPSRRGRRCRGARARPTRCGSGRSPRGRSAAPSAPPSPCGRRRCRPRSGSASWGSGPESCRSPGVAEEPHALHLGPAEGALLALAVVRGAAALAARGRREVVAEGVPVEVERERGERLVARVAPLEHQRAGDRPLLRVEPGLDRVAGVARRDLGQRRQAGGVLARDGAAAAGARGRARRRAREGKASASPASAASTAPAVRGRMAMNLGTPRLVPRVSGILYPALAARGEAPHRRSAPAIKLVRKGVSGSGRRRSRRPSCGSASALPALSPLRWRFMDPPDCVARTRRELALPATT